jgi:hypothetical protein
MSDLVERVVDKIEGQCPCLSRDEALACAKAVITLALEEAAKACEAELVGSFDQYSLGYNDGCKENAAAIRAMIPSGNDPAQDDPGNAE